MLKMSAAVGLTATGVGAPEGAGAAAWGLWNIHSADAAWQRAKKQCAEAGDESVGDASLRNLLGIVPFGDKFDDPSEPGPIEFFKNTGMDLLRKPGKLLREIGTWGF
jgi:type VI secretion system secreted protein VgrG